MNKSLDNANKNFSTFLISRKYQLFCIILDTVILFVIFLLIPINNLSYLSSRFFLFFIIFTFIWTIISYVIGRYHRESSLTFLYLIKESISIPILFLTLEFCFSLIRFFNDQIFINDFQLINFSRIFIYLLTIIIMRLSLRFLNGKLTIKSKKWVLVGSKTKYIQFTKELNRKFKKNIINLTQDKLTSFLYDKEIKGLILEREDDLSKEDIQFLKEIESKGLQVINFIDWFDIYLQRFPPELFNKKEHFFEGFIDFRRSSNELRFKRVGDLLLSIFLLILTLPLILIAMILIFIEDKGDVFYTQKRCGKNGKNFLIIKLRTMYLNSEDDGAQWSRKDDPRVTKIGNILRKTRMDELPQLLSVIKGDMSLIGPRPERPEFDETLIKSIPFYKLRYKIRPGLSGWAQVNFPYGASINDAKIKLSYDLYYLKNFSFWLDLLILLKTLRLVFNAKGSTPK